ncbi:MAG: hypothetical protein C4551_05160 [Bacillota bacterium]|nr:MAG: hypothetical protein C4551_05160 [Bacillota bacterium]
MTSKGLMAARDSRLRHEDSGLAVLWGQGFPGLLPVAEDKAEERGQQGLDRPGQDLDRKREELPG